MTEKRVGQRTIALAHPPSVISFANIGGRFEGEGPLGGYFDETNDDSFFGEKTWEKAESAMQKKVLQRALDQAGLKPKDLDYIFAGDLLNQCIGSSFGLRDFGIPFYGLYGACSTCGETLSLAAMTVSAGYADQVLAVTSSHFGSAEKQFRFPLGYGNQRPLSATWTVTGSGAFLLSAQKSHAKITGITTGKVVDYGVRDSLNMGACMAPAAADTICQNLMDFNRQPQDYDRIITGDLGYVGQTILLELLKEKGFDIKKQHMDCGIEIYDRKLQDTHSGGSGCGCSAVTLSAMILPKIEKGDWKRILFVPTGALLSTVSFNEGQTVPGIAHAVVIEHC